MTKSGQTANGVAHFAPMMELKAPQWNMRNPFNDLIGIALKEREMELKEKEMGLKEKGLGLDEQKFAYGAANDEINRQHAIELQNIKNQNELDKLMQENALKSSPYNKVKAEEDLKDKQADNYYAALEDFKDLVGDDLTPQEFYTAFRNHHKWLGTPGLIDFMNNNALKATELNNLHNKNGMNQDTVGKLMKDASGNGSGKKRVISFGDKLNKQTNK